MPLLTLVVPCCNRPGDDRRPMLDTLLTGLPDRADLEVVLVDDHSTLAYTPPAFSHLRVQRLSLAPGQTHAGTARNRAMAAANGDWLAFVDSDDLADPAGMARLLDGLGQGAWAAADLIVLKAWSFRDDAPDQAATRHLFVNRWIDRAARDDPAALVRVPACWVRVVRRRFVLGAGLAFGATPVAEDVDFAVDLGLARPRIAFAGFVLARVRAGHPSLTARMGAARRGQILQTKLAANARLRAGGLGRWEYPLLTDLLGLMRADPRAGAAWLAPLVRQRARLLPPLADLWRALRARARGA
jgi:glycosyltransferase involved in cell wall biosynthesis